MEMAQPKDPIGSGDKASMRIDPSLVKELAQLLTDNELTEIEVEDGDRRIKVKREPATVIAASAGVPVAAAAPALSAPPMHGKEDIGRAWRETLHGGRQAGQSRGHAGDRRSDEGHEPDHRANRRNHQEDYDQRR